jgi:hypothetical protein
MAVGNQRYCRECSKSSILVNVLKVAKLEPKSTDNDIYSTNIPCLYEILMHILQDAKSSMVEPLTVARNQGGLPRPNCNQVSEIESHSCGLLCGNRPFSLSISHPCGELDTAMFGEVDCQTASLAPRRRCTHTNEQPPLYVSYVHTQQWANKVTTNRDQRCLHIFLSSWESYLVGVPGIWYETTRPAWIPCSTWLLAGITYR